MKVTFREHKNGGGNGPLDGVHSGLNDKKAVRELDAWPVVGDGVEVVCPDGRAIDGRVSSVDWVFHSDGAPTLLICVLPR